MKKSVITALTLSTLFFCQLSRASAHSPIDGVWELEAMYTVDKNGQSQPWCEGAYGVIIYVDGYMSTAVNCTSDPNKSVLYAGPFHIDGQTVFHHAQNASNPNLVRTHSRNFQLTDSHHLELNGDLGSSKVIVKWVRR